MVVIGGRILSAIVWSLIIPDPSRRKLTTEETSIRSRFRITGLLIADKLANFICNKLNELSNIGSSSNNSGTFIVNCLAAKWA